MHRVYAGPPAPLGLAIVGGHEENKLLVEGSAGYHAGFALAFGYDV